MTSIPQELVAAIVDELEDDRPSLKACSVVTSAFCAPSQRHLFRSMWLHRENWHHYSPWQQALHKGTTVPSGTIRRGSSLLSESPHLATYIRDLTIDLPESANEDTPLEHVLREVSNLERFVISGMMVRWDELPSSLASAVLDVIARPTLNSLHFLYVHNVPPATMRDALSSMRVLSIHHTLLGFEDNQDEAETTGPPPAASRLEYLLLNMSLPSTYSLILAPNACQFTKVTRLLVRMGDLSTGLAYGILSSVAGTLMELELDCGVLDSPLNLEWNSISLPNLRTMKLRISLGLRRRLPDGFAGTLIGLPRSTSITILFAVKNRILDGPWLEDGPLLAPGDLQVDRLHCRLVFLDPPHPTSDRNATFTLFCTGLRNALPEIAMEFSRVEDEESFVVRLP
ncbi:hypothetical protein DFH07DRAFT_1064026 [Mycena maculata]|uniref:Uncharacterized protein n=1 Tax=Mycena maculata TaxID=230809 RepID=A0AAD7IEA5_9AGAR|nr:hypothetical protein DFH07DRAFT_1064026 [Mycena maculata]